MIVERMFEHVEWLIEKFADTAAFERGEPYERSRFEGNCLLNEGINEMLNALAGAGGTAFNNANAYLGVGEDNTAAAPAQTGLQGASLTYKGMEAGYPTSGASQQIVFRSVFGVADANNAWKEFTAVNSNSDAGVNLNRKVSDQGTKTNTQTWTLTLTITLT